MAAPAIGVRPRVVPPSTAKVDWSHPLAQGLLFAFSTAHEVDWSGLTTFTRLGGGTTQRATGVGAGVVANSTSVRTGWSVPAACFPSQQRGTMFAVTSGPAAASNFLWDSEGDRFAFYLLNASAHFLASGSDIDGGTYPTGHNTVGQSCDGSTMTGYLNGNRYVSSAYTPGTRTGLGYVMDRNTGTGFNWSSPVSVFIGWSRALTAQEHAQIHANPFCFLRW